MKSLKFNIIALILLIITTSCGPLKYKPVDAKEFPADPDLRVKKNIEEGRGFRVMGNEKLGNTNYSFASSNPLWRATLDTLDFMPLVSANYSGGIIITDWYTDGDNIDESIKVSIRFLSNEIRSDALDVKVFYKKCSANSNCKISEKSGNLVAEIKKGILKKAASYEKIKKEKNFKPYKITEIED